MCETCRTETAVVRLNITTRSAGPEVLTVLKIKFKSVLKSESSCSPEFSL